MFKFIGKSSLLYFLPHFFRPFAVCIPAGFYFFLQNIFTNMGNTLNSLLAKDFSMSADQLGGLSALNFGATMLFLLPIANIIDRISIRKFVLFCCFITLFSLILFFSSSSMMQLYTAFFLAGSVAMAGLLSSLKLTSLWFPATQIATANGMILLIGNMGNLMAQAPAVMLLEAIKWRGTVFVEIILAVFVLILVLLFVEDRPEKNNSAEKGRFFNFFMNSLKNILKNKNNWLCGFYLGCINFPIFIFGALWGNRYLVQAQHLDRGEAALVISVLFLGAIIFSQLVGFLSDKYGTRKLPLFICSLIGLGSILALLLQDRISLHQLGLIYFLLGISNSATVVAFSIVKESNKNEFTSTAQGFALTLMVSTGLLQPVFSRLLEWKWDGSFKAGVAYYSIDDYRRALMLIPLGLFISIFLAIFIKDKKIP